MEKALTRTGKPIEMAYATYSPERRICTVRYTFKPHLAKAPG